LRDSSSPIAGATIIRKRGRWIAAAIVGGVLLVGFALPGSLTVPVSGATSRDWNPKSFWYEPWGISGVHKGIDIFAPKGRDVVAAASGLVVYTGDIAQGGTVAVVLGPKWRYQYYAHLDSLSVRTGSWIWRGEKIGAVGNSGNAAGKQPHLHFAVVNMVPHPWRITSQTQGWRKMFYMNPMELME
jgi:murein DD-endopeptidase MepM/ murein hydrolase activator NlpD